MSQSQLLLFGNFAIEVPQTVVKDHAAPPLMQLLTSDNVVVQQLMDEGAWMDRNRLDLARVQLREEVREYGSFPNACLAHDTREALKLVRERLQHL